MYQIVDEETENMNSKGQPLIEGKYKVQWHPQG